MVTHRLNRGNDEEFRSITVNNKQAGFRTILAETFNFARVILHPPQSSPEQSHHENITERPLVCNPSSRLDRPSSGINSLLSVSPACCVNNIINVNNTFL